MWEGMPVATNGEFYTFTGRWNAYLKFGNYWMRPIFRLARHQEYRRTHSPNH